MATTKNSTPIVRVAGCVLRDTEGRMLLLHRNTPKFVHWELPGGKLEAGEDEVTAASREISEELAVEVCNLVKLGSTNLTSDSGQPFVFTWFLADCAAGGVPRITEPHTFDDLRYFSIKELTERHDLSANMQALLAQIQQKQVTL